MVEVHQHGVEAAVVEVDDGRAVGMGREVPARGVVVEEEVRVDTIGLPLPLHPRLPQPPIPLDGHAGDHERLDAPPQLLRDRFGRYLDRVRVAELRSHDRRVPERVPGVPRALHEHLALLAREEVADDERVKGLSQVPDRRPAAVVASEALVQELRAFGLAFFHGPDCLHIDGHKLLVHHVRWATTAPPRRCVFGEAQPRCVPCASSVPLDDPSSGSPHPHLPAPPDVGGAASWRLTWSPKNQPLEAAPSRHLHLMAQG
mmetsp:Transcript_71551/g.225972  ORF Transcript_71551/g.225972 Transcript_71551/m.225972 type:complete len:259 (+) Transcript_71551:548-1324(+)